MTGERPELVVYPDLAALSRGAADKFLELALLFIREHGRFTVALSGGTTPHEMYRRLASPDYRYRIDWSRVCFFWGDERPVPPDSPDSNFRVANEALLSHVPVPEENINRIHGEENPTVAAEEYEQTLREFFGPPLPRFDLILLGLGTDGHTASLFPYSEVLDERERWCAAPWVAQLNSYRITLTMPVLNNGANDVFLVAGSDKATALRQVLHGPFDPQRVPAQLIKPEHGNLLFLVDREVASATK